MKKVVRALFAIAFGVWTTAAPADDYPSKLIRFVVPNPAGGGADTTARQISRR